MKKHLFAIIFAALGFGLFLSVAHANADSYFGASHVYAAQTLGQTGQGASGMVIDGAGNIFVANSINNSVTKISPDGTSSTFASTGTRPVAIAIDGTGNLYTANNGSNDVSKITPTGQSAILGSTGLQPIAITVNPNGTVFTANSGSNNVSKILADGTSNILGNTGQSPTAIVLDGSGNVYTANSSDNNVTKITSAGVSSVFASTGNYPVAMAIDAQGNIYTTNLFDSNISEITPGGVSSTYASTPHPANLIALDIFGNVFAASTSANTVYLFAPSWPLVNVGTTTGVAPSALIVDSTGHVYTANSNSFNLTKFSPINPPQIFLSSNSETVQLGQSISGYTILNQGGLVTSYSISTPPAMGLTFNTSTGLLSGAPTQFSSQLSYTITATNLAGNSTANYTINISLPPSISLSGSSETVVLGNSISGYTITSSGGPVTSYSISPSISNGLAFDNTTGLISGTPTSYAAPISYLITATNAYGSSARSYTISVPAPPSISLSQSVESIQLGSSIVGYTINVMGGEVAAYSISPHPAAGLTFNASTGTISGIPMYSGPTHIYTITATNVNGTTSATYSLTVNPLNPYIRLSRAGEAALAGQSVRGYQVSVFGGSALSFSISPAIGNGLTFDTGSGLISGSPLAPTSPTTYTITAHFATTSSSATYTLSVLVPNTPNSFTSSTLGHTGTSPRGLVVDNQGNMYTVNFIDNTVTKIAPDGTSLVFATTGTNPSDIAMDAAGNIYTSNSGSNNVSKITPAGNSTILGTTDLTPAAIAIDANGNVYTANSAANDVTEITPDGISSVLGTTGHDPQDITVDSAGNVYTANYGSSNYTEFAAGSLHLSYDLNNVHPQNLVSDNAGSIYVADFVENSVTIFNQSLLNYQTIHVGLNPYALAVDWYGAVYSANYGDNSVSRIFNYNQTIVGAPGTEPRAITVDLKNNIYVLNSVDQTITKLTPNFAPFITLSSNGEAVALGNAVSGYSIINSGGLATSYSITPALPSGLTFNTTTGLISGNPTSVIAQTYYHITATNAHGNSQATYTITVAELPVFSLSASSEIVQSGHAIAGYSITHSGGDISSYSISPAAGNGLTFNTTTGLLSGNIAAYSAPVTYTITAHGIAGTATNTYIVNVVAAPIIALSSSSESVQVGHQIVGYTIANTGGPVTAFTISPAPSYGLSFDSTTGLLSGSPDFYGAPQTYIIGATNSTGNSSANFTLTVNPSAPLIFLSSDRESVVLGEPISGYSITALGGAVIS